MATGKQTGGLIFKQAEGNRQPGRYRHKYVDGQTDIKTGCRVTCRQFDRAVGTQILYYPHNYCSPHVYTVDESEFATLTYCIDRIDPKSTVKVFYRWTKISLDKVTMVVKAGGHGDRQKQNKDRDGQFKQKYMDTSGQGVRCSDRKVDMNTRGLQDIERRVDTVT